MSFLPVRTHADELSILMHSCRRTSSEGLRWMKTALCFLFSVPPFSRLFLFLILFFDRLLFCSTMLSSPSLSTSYSTPFPPLLFSFFFLNHCSSFLFLSRNLNCSDSHSLLSSSSCSSVSYPAKPQIARAHVSRIPAHSQR